MELNNLSDNELIDYVIKHDTDPVRVRLATHMQRVSGAIVDDLLNAGMDDTWCDFMSIINSARYHPGEYIRHLEDELNYTMNKLSDARKEIEDLQSRTIMDLIGELKQEIKTAEWCRDEAYRDKDKAQENERLMKHKLDMWAVLNR